MTRAIRPRLRPLVMGAMTALVLLGALLLALGAASPSAAVTPPRQPCLPGDTRCQVGTGDTLPPPTTAEPGRRGPEVGEPVDPADVGGEGQGEGGGDLDQLDESDPPEDEEPLGGADADAPDAPDDADADADAGDAEGDDADDADADGAPIWLVLIIALVAGALGAVVTLLVRRTDAPPPVPPAAGPVPPPPTAPVPDSTDRQALVAAAIEVRDLVPSEALRERLAQALREAGVEEVRAEGEPFDPDRHIAVDRVTAIDPGDHNRVATTERPGYVDRGAVLRLPEVVVSRTDGDTSGGSNE